MPRQDVFAAGVLVRDSDAGPRNSSARPKQHRRQPHFGISVAGVAGTAALKSRTLEEFVPSLLALLATPVKSSVGVSMAAWSDTIVGGGVPDSFHIVLLISYVLHRETATEVEENVIGNPTFGLTHVSCFGEGTPVWTARKGQTGNGYNLVVADFHTYFVGQTGVLCQDLLPPRRTNSVVPGLARK